ncbi:hypothetical protein [Sedimentibacter sp. B4]|uniref:hypothetical protein n=1 Tax=Sedimentibacter sp. B4 TaxID=304766 RepID=UPI0002F00803|nr:hypothetical protein [Sedimentibacter sp. B4]
MNKNIIKVLSLSACLSMATMTAAFAQTLELPPEAAQMQITAVDEALYEKQAAFDKILFEEKLKEIEEKGITVTHTYPADGYVEVGITPFNEENQKYIIEILGSDEVEVVDGIMAITLTDELMSTTSAPDVKTAPDAATSGPAEEAAPEAQVVSATDAKVISAKDDVKEEKGISPLAIGAGAAAAVLLGIGAVLFKKKTA